MRILMITNTYLPQVGGVSLSVDRFSRQYLEAGHDVLVVAPDFGEPTDDGDLEVVRTPAITHFNQSDFSVPVTVPGLTLNRVELFQPEIVHAHHPFLLGANARRLATELHAPLVYTYHTMYEWYTHNLSTNWERAKQFIIALAAGYSNLCDRVIAPSESVAHILRERGVESAIHAIPTGVDVTKYREGDGMAFRKLHHVPDSAFLVGHLGRLSPEKNMNFLAEGVAAFLERRPEAHFALIGDGPSREEVESLFRSRGLAERLHSTGILKGDDVVNAYHAMDVFAFASKSETQGMVLVESMTAGTPIVTLDAPGGRDAVEDGQNGRIVREESPERFADMLDWVAQRSGTERTALANASRETAADYAIPKCADRVLEVYRDAIAVHDSTIAKSQNDWQCAIERIATEWDLLRNVMHSMLGALSAPGEDLPSDESHPQSS